jgi:hypothetical protein
MSAEAISGARAKVVTTEKNKKITDRLKELGLDKSAITDSA